MIQSVDSSSGTVGEAYLGILYLPGAGLTAELPDNFGGLGQSGGPGGMAFGDEAPAGIHRDPSPDLRCPLVEQLGSLPPAAEAQGLVIEELGDAEGVMDFRQAYLLRSDPGHFVNQLGRPDGDLFSVSTTQ